MQHPDLAKFHLPKKYLPVEHLFNSLQFPCMSLMQKKYYSTNDQFFDLQSQCLLNLKDLLYNDLTNFSIPMHLLHKHATSKAHSTLLKFNSLLRKNKNNIKHNLNCIKIAFIHKNHAIEMMV